MPRIPLPPGVSTDKAFRQDLKRCERRGKDLGKLWAVVKLLVGGEPLPDRYKAHPLSDRWGRRSFECHVEPDWLLVWVWDIYGGKLTLVRTGTHSDLFG